MSRTQGTSIVIGRLADGQAEGRRGWNVFFDDAGPENGQLSVVLEL